MKKFFGFSSCGSEILTVWHFAFFSVLQFLNPGGGGRVSLNIQPGSGVGAKTFWLYSNVPLDGELFPPSMVRGGCMQK